MKATLVFLVILCLITSPCFCMSVPSKPAKEEKVSVHGGGKGKAGKILITTGIVIIVVGIVCTGEYADKREKKDEEIQSDPAQTSNPFDGALVLFYFASFVAAGTGLIIWGAHLD
ncbi:hypothetical protein ACFL6F_02960 [Planctomycetota bacterium]